MTRLLIGMLLILFLFPIPAEALEITAPEVPESGMQRMPQNTDSFSDALLELMQNSIRQFQPEFQEAMEICSGIFAVTVLFSFLPVVSENLQKTSSFAGAILLGSMMFQHTNSMISYAADIVQEISEYGKLLCPVLTTALAAQGSITASAALYTGTIAFLTLTCTLVSRVFVPMVYLFLALSVAYGALGAEILKRFSEAVKTFLSWILKTLLIVFTTYMSITGVVSGTTDAAALKATKVTLSSAIPVVGSILSDASESILVSMGILKNAAGVYGILAVLAVFMGPFLKVGLQYLLLKSSGAICGIFTNKSISTLINDFSAAMGILLAMVATSCILVFISTICFLKVVT